MSVTKWLRIIVAGLLIGAVAFIGLITALFLLLMGTSKILVWSIGVSLVLLLSFIILRGMHFLPLKAFKISSAIILCAALFIVFGYLIYAAYMDRLEIVSTQDVALHEYEPFTDNNQLATLEGTARLQLTDNLPVMDGATALYPVYAAFAQAVYSEEKYPYWTDSAVMANQTGGAFQNLLEGKADIVFMAAPSAAQMRQAERYGIDLELTPIGREAFVFFVHERNPLQNIDVQAIQSIYSDEITHWQQLGGEDAEILAFQRPANSGSQTALESIMGDIPLMDPPTEQVVSGMGGIIEETANYQNRRNALGYSFRYFSTEMVEEGRIKHLKIDGVAPTKENIRNNTYPLTSDFYAITVGGNKHDHLQTLIEWILSAEGQTIIDRTGYVPVEVHS